MSTPLVRLLLAVVLVLLATSASVLAQVEAARPRLLLPPGHTDQVSALAFSPDNKLLASGGKDGVVLLWEVGTWRLLETLHSDDRNIRTVEFGKDSDVLLWGADSDLIVPWD